MAVGRYVTHAAVLLLVLGISGFTSVSRQVDLNLRLGAVNAQGLVIGEGGEVGSVQLGRLSTIVKPVAIPTSAPASHAPLVYEVKDGDTLSKIAERYKVSQDSLRWSNFATLKNTGKDVSKGDKILIPPVEGVVVTIQDGDTPDAIAAAYHVDAKDLIDYNFLRTGANVPLIPGTLLVVPNGKGPDFEKPAPPVQVRPSFTTTSTTTNRQPAAGFTVGGPGRPVTGAPGNRFAPGYCTWYVFNLVPYIPWLGNAWEWFSQAQAYGWPTGQAPRVGAIMVTWESSFGHVAYLTDVYPDGSWSVTEMNFKGLWVVSTRTIRPGGVPLIGFIYPPGR